VEIATTNLVTLKPQKGFALNVDLETGRIKKEAVASVLAAMIIAKKDIGIAVVVEQ